MSKHTKYYDAQVDTNLTNTVFTSRVCGCCCVSNKVIIEQGVNVEITNTDYNWFGCIVLEKKVKLAKINAVEIQKGVDLPGFDTYNVITNWFECPCVYATVHSGNSKSSFRIEPNYIPYVMGLIAPKSQEME